MSKCYISIMTFMLRDYSLLYLHKIQYIAHMNVFCCCKMQSYKKEMKYVSKANCKLIVAFQH